MTNYTADEIRDIVLEKDAELYHGKIILYFQAGKIGVIEYQRTEKKADEGTPRKRGDPRGRKV
ncbi:hypothetical protein LCGC14_0964770 [marine sediment metagenome]|uniref:Uncharacterized protein n=1 Tax=marine sediment metagenome TaxID=412755 RepID=A0A0F9NZJ2_9ZZZZ